MPDRQISFKPLLLFLVFVAILEGLVYALHKAHQIRQEKLYLVYEQETQDYIARHKDGLAILFTNIISTSANCQSTPNCQISEVNQLVRLIPNELSDWEATGFIKQLSNGDILFMDTAGYIKSVYIPTQNQTLVASLINGQIKSIPIQDYLWEIEGNEAFIPVKGNRGQVIGLIVRGVTR